MNTSLLVHLSRLLWYSTNLRKLSMSISSSKSTVNMYLISDPLADSLSRQNGQWSLSRLSESKPGKPVHSTIHVPSHGLRKDGQKPLPGIRTGYTSPPNYIEAKPNRSSDS